MSLIAGIDFSTHAIDLVLIDENTGEAEWRRYDDLPGNDAFDRARAIRDALPSRAWWTDQGVIAAGIEQPRGHHGVTPLFRVQGGILQCLPPELLVQPWNPAEWRKACGLKGNATKEDVRDFVDELHGHKLGWPFDAYDAYSIAYATRSVLERQEAA